MSAGLAVWIGIAGVALTAVVTRLSFIAFGERVQLPPAAERALRYAPAAALGAILAPSLLLHDGRFQLLQGNHRLLAAAIGALVVWRTRSILWTIVAGLAAYTALRLWL
jgi:branched-subunit amino acid transport protein